MPRCSHCMGSGWVGHDRSEGQQESDLLRTPAPPYVPGPNDHVWEKSECVKCKCARLGSRAILPCPIATPAPTE